MKELLFISMGFPRNTAIAIINSLSGNGKCTQKSTQKYKINYKCLKFRDFQKIGGRPSEIIQKNLSSFIN